MGKGKEEIAWTWGTIGANIVTEVVPGQTEKWFGNSYIPLQRMIMYWLKKNFFPPITPNRNRVLKNNPKTNENNT